MNRRVRAALAAVVMMAPGCALKTPPDAAALRAEGMSKVAIPERYVAPGAAPTGMLEANWVAGFKDDQLTAAIVEAIRNNPDLAVAAERVQQAMLRAKQAGAKLYPSVDVLARGGTKVSGDI